MAVTLLPSTRIFNSSPWRNNAAARDRVACPEHPTTNADGYRVVLGACRIPPWRCTTHPT